MNAKIKGASRVFAGLAAAASLCFAAAALAEESAPPPNILVVEASQLIRAAEDARSPEEKIPLLEDARDKLQSVIDNHPASDLALKLATGQSIGAISLPALDRALETALEGCWTSPTVECLSRLVLDHAESSGSCEIQLRAYLALADASIALENFEKADSAMKRAQELDSSCDGSLTHSSIAALSSIVARDLSAEQLARVSELVAQGFMPQSETVRLIRSIGENGFLSAAAKIVEAVPGDDKRGAHFELALARGKHDLTSGAEGTESFSEAKRIAAEAEDAVEGAELLARVAREQAKSNAAPDALATANAAQALALTLFFSEEAKPQPRELAQLARAEWKIGDVQDARELLERAHEAADQIPNRRSQNLQEIAEAEIALGRPEDARTTLERALADWGGDDNLRAMIELHQEMEDFTAALRIVPKISSGFSRIIHRINIAAGMHGIGETPAARLEALDVLAEIASLEDVTQRVALSSAVFINGAGELVDARAVLDNAHRELASIYSDRERLNKEIWLLWARVKSPIPDDGYVAAETERLVKALSSSSGDEQAARFLVGAAREAELYGPAIAAANLVDDVDWQIRRLAEIAESQVKSGDSGGAAMTLARAPYSLTEVREIDTFTALAAAQAAAGLQDKAAATLIDARRDIQDRNHFYPRYSLAKVSEAQAEVGDLSGARQTLALAEEWPYAIETTRDGERLLDVLIDVAQLIARATGNKRDAMPVLLQAIDIGLRSSEIRGDTLRNLALNSLWFTAAGASVPESLLHMTEHQMRANAGDESRYPGDFTCRHWAAVRSVSGGLGDPMAAFRRLEAELYRMGFYWASQGNRFNCVGQGVINASLIENQHDALPSTFEEWDKRNSVISLLSSVPDYPLDDGAIAIILDEGNSAYAIRDALDAIEHQFEDGFTQQARLLAQQVAVTGSAVNNLRQAIPRLVRFQLLFGMPSRAKTLLAQALASLREDCSTSYWPDCTRTFRHLLTSVAILEGATAK